MSEEISIEQQYPSVELAYPIAVASYESTTRRLDAIDGRLQATLTMVSTVTAAFVTVALTYGTKIWSIWFLFAMTAAAVSIALGLFARDAGKVILLSPAALRDAWLHNPRMVFMVDLIHDAADNFNANIDRLESKWRRLVQMTIAFTFELFFLVVWTAVARS
ncbi:MAG: hypothetical protein IPN69_08140 [Acidobacteria bacterium]|nr:hypothetical protein [Acidobacteriota bacterium]